MAHAGVSLEKSREEALEIFNGDVEGDARVEFHHYLHTAVESGTEVEALDRAFEWLKVDPTPLGEPGVFAKLVAKVPEKERPLLVAQIVYTLFLGVFREESIQSDEGVEFTIIQHIAAHCSKGTTKAILSEYKGEKLAHLTYHCLWNYDEGSYVIKHMIDNPTLKKIVKGWSNYTFDRVLMFELKELGVDSEEMLTRLEAKFNEEMDIMFDAIHPQLPDLDKKTMVAFFKLRGCTGMLANDFDMPKGGIAALLSMLHSDRASLDKDQQSFGDLLIDQMKRFIAKDFSKIVYMLPTIRPLQSSQYLQSVIEAYDEMELTPTIVIYDQSEGDQLEQNKAFAAKIGVRHFDKDETLKMADTEGVRDLIDCNDGKTFGYAGGRNACFFLTGSVVEGEGCQMMAMGDDDMEMSIGSIFYDVVSDAPSDFKGNQSKRTGFYYGRMTTDIVAPPDFNQLLSGARVVTPITTDIDEDRADTICPLSGSVFPMLDSESAKAKMLKPTPCPGEENDVVVFAVDRQWSPPMFHLSGKRLPKTEAIPTHPWSGMESLLWTRLYSYWGDVVKTASEEDATVGGASRVIINQIAKKEFEEELIRIFNNESLVQIEAHLKKHPEDEVSLGSIQKTYQSMGEEVRFATSFAKTIAKHPDRIEEVVERHEVTKEKHPLAWMLYKTDRVGPL